MEDTDGFEGLLNDVINPKNGGMSNEGMVITLDGHKFKFVGSVSACIGKDTNLIMINHVHKIVARKLLGDDEGIDFNVEGCIYITMTWMNKSDLNLDLCLSAYREYFSSDSKSNDKFKASIVANDDNVTLALVQYRYK